MADKSESQKSSSEAAKEVPLEFVGKKDAASGAPSGEAGGRKASPSSGMSHTMRFALSVLVAMAADALEMPLEPFPPAWILVDVVTAGAFFFLWGFRWEVALVLIPELVPGLNVFPTWFLLALYLGQQHAPPSSPPQQPPR